MFIIFLVEINGNVGRITNFNRSLNNDEYNKIPRKNFMAQNYFLNSR